MLLLDVRVDIDPGHEHQLNEWYHTHVPRLVSIPGYVSGRRYIALGEGPKYAALYEIEDPSYLPSLLGADHDRRHPLTLSEWAEWDARFVPYMRHGTTNLYQAADEMGMLIGDLPIVEVRFDTPAGDEAQLLSAVRGTPGVRKASRLSACTDPAVEWLDTRPENLLLVQVEDDDAARALCSNELFTNTEAVAYAQIARHWPYLKEA